MEVAITARVTNVTKHKGYHSRISFDIEPINDEDKAWATYSTSCIKWNPIKPMYHLLRKHTIVQMICTKDTYKTAQWKCEFLNPQLDHTSFRYLLKYAGDELVAEDKHRLEFLLGLSTYAKTVTQLVKQWKKVDPQGSSNQEKLDVFIEEVKKGGKQLDLYIMDYIMEKELWNRCDLFWRFQYHQWFTKELPVADRDLGRAITRAVDKVPFSQTFAEVTIALFQDNPWTCHVSSHTKNLDVQKQGRMALIQWLEKHGVIFTDVEKQQHFFCFWHCFQQGVVNAQDTYVEDAAVLQILKRNRIELRSESIMALSQRYDTHPDWVTSPSVEIVRTMYEDRYIWQRKKVKDLEDEFITLVETRRGKQSEGKLSFPTYFTPLQNEAFRAIETRALSVIQGAAGTGKSEIISQIIARANTIGCKGLVLAHYNQAVENLKKRGIPAAQLMTCCSFLLHGHSKYDFVIIEEAGTVTLSQAVQLLKKVSVNLCFLGDMYQLPPIGEGAGMVFQDLVTYLDPIVLTEVKRTTDTSAILQNAQAILRGENKIIEDDSFQWRKYPFFSYRPHGGLNMDHITLHMLDKIFVDWTAECMCITARNEDVLLLASYLHHKHLHSLEQFQTPTFTHRCTFACLRVGSRVMITRKILDYKQNDRNQKLRAQYSHSTVPVLAVKGDVGIIVEHVPGTKRYTVHVNGKDVPCFDSMFQLGYAGTTHRCQGGEAGHLYKFLPDPECPLLDSRFLYVGITRGKQKVDLIGEEAAYQKAILRGFQPIRSTLSRLTKSLKRKRA